MSSQTDGASETVGSIVGDSVGDAVGACKSVGGVVDAVGDDVGSGEAVGGVDGDVVHCPHDLTQVYLALPRLFPLSSYIREPHLFFSTICEHVKT